MFDHRQLDGGWSRTRRAIAALCAVAMIAGMAPVLHPDTYHFCTLTDQEMALRAASMEPGDRKVSASSATTSDSGSLSSTSDQ